MLGPAPRASWPAGIQRAKLRTARPSRGLARIVQCEFARPGESAIGGFLPCLLQLVGIEARQLHSIENGFAVRSAAGSEELRGAAGNLSIRENVQATAVIRK